MKPRYWLARTILALWVLTQALVILSEPQSLAARSLSQSGPMGAFFLCTLAIVSSVALADVLLNDVRWRLWAFARDWRHVGFMVMAMLQVMLASVIQKAIGFSPLLLTFWIPAALCIGIVPLDMVARHRTTA